MRELTASQCEAGSADLRRAADGVYLKSQGDLQLNSCSAFLPLLILKQLSRSVVCGCSYLWLTPKSLLGGPFSVYKFCSRVPSS